MIKLADITVASNHVASRARKMLVRRLTPTEWKVTPTDGKQHTIKRVRFVRRNREWTIDCEGFKDGKPCPANYHGRLCAHTWAVYRALEIQEIRRQRRHKDAA